MQIQSDAPDPRFGSWKTRRWEVFRSTQVLRAGALVDCPSLRWIIHLKSDLRWIMKQYLPSMFSVQWICSCLWHLCRTTWNRQFNAKVSQCKQKCKFPGFWACSVAQGARVLKSRLRLGKLASRARQTPNVSQTCLKANIWPCILRHPLFPCRPHAYCVLKRVFVMS